MKKKAAVCVFLVSLGLSILGAPAVVAAQYLGETIWTVSLTQDEYGPKSQTHTMTGAITRAGGAYYTMQGYTIVPGDEPLILSGGGVLIGETLYLNLTSSLLHTDSPEDWRDSGVVQIQINKTTLNGTFYAVYHNFKLSSTGPSPIFGSGFAAGTVTRTGPAINLTPGASMGSTSLLLLEK